MINFSSDYKYINLTVLNFHTYLCGPVGGQNFP